MQPASALQVGQEAGPYSLLSPLLIASSTSSFVRKGVARTPLMAIVVTTDHCS